MPGFLHRALFAAALLLCAGTPMSLAASSSDDDSDSIVGRSSPPNILVILTDDQDLHLGSLNHMPQLQSLLVQQGLTFNKHYGHVSLCCPARATLWTGKHAHNTNVTSVDNDVAGGAWQQVQAMGWYKDNLAAWMQEAGYATYYSGKIYNGYGRPNYCNPHCLQGYTMGDFLVGPNIYSYYNSSFVHVGEDGWGNPTEVPDYSTDMITKYVKGYIDNALDADKPFFAVAAPVACHVSTGVTYRGAGVANNDTLWPYPLPRKDYRDAFPDISIPRTSNFNPVNRTGVAGVWGLDRLTEANVNMQENYYRLRAQTLLSVDDMVDELVNYLDQKGILDNTFIIYTSDNGFHLGNHRLQPGKEQCFEEDVNIPFIVRGPGVAKGESTDLVTGHIDLAPTILGIAGASLDHELDGTPITFPLKSKGDFERNGAARGEFAHLEYWGPFKQEGMQGSIGIDYNVNLQTYKALRLQGVGYNLMYSVWCQDGAHELYDMSWDQYQMTNLHPLAPLYNGTNAYLSGMDTVLGRPINAVIARLDALVLVEKTCKGDVCRHPWRELHPGLNVSGFMEALDPAYDRYYDNAYAVAPVGWKKCYTGYSNKSSATLYDLQNEEPVWLNTEIKSSILKGAAAPMTSPTFAIFLAWMGLLLLWELI